MEGTAFPTAKEPRPGKAVGGGWLNDQIHFALSAHTQEDTSWGSFNLRLEGGEGAFWADVDTLEIISPEFAVIDGTVRKAEGVYAPCEGQRFQLSAEDGQDSKRGVDGMLGSCGPGEPFGGDVTQGSIRIDDAGLISPE